MMGRVRRILWALVAAAVVVLIAWTAGVWSSPTDRGDRPASSVGDRPQGLAVQPGLDLYPRDNRAPLPAFTGTTLDGDRFDSSTLRRTIVVINVWGSWCAPCRAETPELVRLANEYTDRGVRFVGIDTRDTTAAARAFVRTFKVPYPSVVDPEGQLLLTLRDVVPTSVVPSTVVVDRRGLVAARILGRATYTTLKGILDDERATDNVGKAGDR